MQCIIECEPLRVAFRAHAAASFCEENIDFLVAVYNLQHLQGQQRVSAAPPTQALHHSGGSHVTEQGALHHRGGQVHVVNSSCLRCSEGSHVSLHDQFGLVTTTSSGPGDFAHGGQKSGAKVRPFPDEGMISEEWETTADSGFKTACVNDSDGLHVINMGECAYERTTGLERENACPPSCTGLVMDKDANEVYEAAADIIRTYITVHAPQVVNISDSAREDILREFDEWRTSGKLLRYQNAADLFKTATEEVAILLRFNILPSFRAALANGELALNGSHVTARSSSKSDSLREPGALLPRDVRALLHDGGMLCTELMQSTFETPDKETGLCAEPSVSAQGDPSLRLGEHSNMD